MSVSLTHKLCSFTREQCLKSSFIFLSKYLSSTSPKFPSNDDVDTSNEVPVFEYPKPARSAQRVYAWGVAETGALGIFTAKLRKQMKHIHEYYDHPRRLTFSHVYEVNDITCGYGFTLFSVEPNFDKGPHKVFGCGINTDSQIGYHCPSKKSHLALVLNPSPIEIPFKNPKTKVQGLAAGRAHSVILTEEGVFTLGNNAYGQCGRPVIENENYDGSKVIHHIHAINGIKIKSVACGQDHSMFITAKGEVYACGWNADGQTGQNNFESHGELKQVTGDINGEDIIKVACSGDCVLALNNKGQVFGWGNAEYGQLGDNLIQLGTSKHLVNCEKLGKIVDVAAGGSFCTVLNEDGQVFTWGYGILGKGPNAQRSPQPTEIPQILFGKNEFSPDSKVVSITCGLNHQMALTNKGELFAWGLNRGGCLGLGHDDDQYFPFRVSVGALVSKVCCGVDHTVVICKSH